jgi:hypothetical protein
MSYVIDRLKEPSTWRGLIMLATAFGVNISPDLSNVIISVGVGGAGLVGVVTRG